MPADQQPLLDEEQGASDNVMTLSPGDHPDIADWKDGSEYVFKEVRVRQQSPGQFIVISAEPEPGEAEQSSGERAYGGEGQKENMTGQHPEGEESTEEAPTDNPTINRLMRKRR